MKIKRVALGSVSVSDLNNKGNGITSTLPYNLTHIRKLYIQPGERSAYSYV